ncbi:MAG TPA: methyltransferase domain-containing protein [Anaeromyxobacteraceae bacterium]|nr:methyltransferase domain-containing protein [Anaeromyxobacteraceae bacterium]
MGREPPDRRDAGAREDLNPHARQMADQSMFRTLAAQAEAIWPQEAALLRRYALPDEARILDAGCGTGEIASRLAALYPAATVLGVDVLDAPLELARRRHGALHPRLRFEKGSVFQLDLPAASFDLAVCRHVIQAIPEPERALAELVRVTRPGGWVHVLAEDYGMIHFPPRRLDPDQFWPEVPRQFGRSAGTDMFVGRRTWSILRGLGLERVEVDYVLVDTLRVSRETFAAIWEAWRDGYVDAIAERTRFSSQEARAHFDDQIATLRDPDAYAVWMVPVVSGQRAG